MNITVCRDQDGGRADLLLRWKGGAITELTVPLKRKPPKIRTSEDTVDLLRRLAVHYPDAQIAGILNRQHRTTARGMSFTASRVQSLRYHWGIPCHQPGDDLPEGDLLNVTEAARELRIAPSTLLRWLNDGFITGEQVDPRRAVADPPHQPAPRHAHRQHPPTDGSPSATQPRPSASPARPYCRRSSAASCAPS